LAGTNSGGVFRSTDNGNTWTAINAGLPSYDVYAIASDANGYLYVGTDGGGVFRSTDNGGTWAAINTGLLCNWFRCFAINSSGRLFAGGDACGAYRLADNGTSWTALNTGLTCPDVHALAFNSEGYLFAATWGNYGGVYRSVASTTSMRLVEDIAPIGYELGQNYPNPFNPVTAISYQLPKQGHITLKVYNVLGREVATLVNEVKEPGTHKVVWDATCLPSGVYLYEMTTRNTQVSKKALLTK
jgi:hypothetical protein